MALPATPVPDPLDRIDELLSQLEKVEAEVLRLGGESLAEQQAIAAKYAPLLNPLYRQGQAIFDELRSLAETHRTSLLPRGKKSANRTAGTVGWRLNTRLVQHVDTDVLIARIRALGPTISRKLLRRVVTWELRQNNIKAIENRGLIAGIDGLEVVATDDFFAKPRYGWRVARRWWPELQDVVGHEAINAVFRDPEADAPSS